MICSTSRNRANPPGDIHVYVCILRDQVLLLLPLPYVVRVFVNYQIDRGPCFANSRIPDDIFFEANELSDGSSMEDILLCNNSRVVKIAQENRKINNTSQIAKTEENNSKACKPTASRVRTCREKLIENYEDQSSSFENP